ncbi:DUF4962 domain-containing protein [Victivallaceae bacterium BBE-744-WT-12]|uniref:DUF4962 domain-containing protein n=1 Tax=Victivallis lenta TaxID=2606640 RepID=A0A844G842_9BACT|nr:DUF4962 domain-containing protein [Victivallis lenta]MST99536.1 DUF4962 domain-containing protein [Victivallis lenta]
MLTRMTVCCMMMAGAALHAADIGPVELKKTSRPDLFSVSEKNGIYEAANTIPSRFCTLDFQLNCPWKPELILRFEYRNVFSANEKVSYTGVNFFDTKKRSTFTRLPVSAEWAEAAIPFSRLSPGKDGVFDDSDRFLQLAVYSRIADGDAPAKVALEVRNLRIATDPGYDPYNSAGLTLLPKKETEPVDKGNGLWEAVNDAPSRFCTLGFRIGCPWRPELTLQFEYRNIPTAGARIAYTAVNLFDAEKRSSFTQLPVSTEWRKAEIPFAQLRPIQEGVFDTEDRFIELDIYSRIANADAPGKVALEVRNIRFTPDPGYNPYNQGGINVLSRKNMKNIQKGDAEWEAANETASRFCTLPLRINCAFRPDLLLRFEYRNLPGEDAKIAYTGVNLYDDQKRSAFTALPVSAEWHKAEIAFSRLRPIQGGVFGAKDRFIQLDIYSRIANDDAPGKATIQVRNIQFAVDPAYNPLDGVRVSYSAQPMFNWKRDPKATGYRLEYSLDPAMPDAATQKVELERNFFVPPEFLKPGLWHYRVTALPEGREVARDKLLIPERSHHWPRPAFDFAKLAATPHPRLLPLARYYAEINGTNQEKTAEKLLNFTVPPNPEPYREGADPNIRAWVEWYGKIAGGVISSTGNKLSIVGQSAMLTGREDLKQKARELVLAVSRTWDPESGSQMKRADLQAANLLMGMGYCFDAAYDLMTPEERAEASKAIETRGRQFWVDANPFRGNESQNHPWDRAQALAFAAVTLAENPESREWFDFVADLYATRFLPSLGFDGENNEGLAYWSYGLGLAIRYVDLVKSVAGMNYYTQPWLAKTARFPLYCAPPDGFWGSFADNGKPNHAARGPVNREFTRRLARQTGDPVALWYAGFPRDGELQAQPPTGIPQSVVYPHIGLAVFNTFLADGRENVAVGFHSGKFFAGHQHADQNAFVINAYGDKLAIDGGYYDWYGSKHFKAYSVHTQAHNTILVNGEGQSWNKKDADGRLTATFDSPGFGYAAGDASAPKVYNGKLSKFNRRLLFVKPSVVVIFDELAAKEPSTFRWQLLSHTEEMKDTRAEGSNFSIVRPLARLDGRMLLPENTAMQVEKAYSVDPVQGYSVDVIPHPQPEWRLFTENAAPAAATEFLAAMRIARAGDQAAPPEYRTLQTAGAAGVETRDGDDRIIALFNRRPGKSFTLENITTDAETAALRIAPDGTVRDAMISGGTTLRFQDRELLRLDAPGAAALQKPRTAAPEKVQILTINDVPMQLERHVVSRSDGSSTTLYTGTLEIPADARLNMQVGSDDDRPVHFVLSNGSARHTNTLSGNSATLFLNQGTYLFYLATAGNLRSVALRTSDAGRARGIMHPADYRLPENAVLVEAENPTPETRNSVEIADRPSASGGKTTANWSTAGQFAEWSFRVPESGRYRLLIRTATSYSQIFREITIDGKAPSGNIGTLQWGSTGGFGYSPEEWRWVELPCDLTLSAGEHRLGIRMLSGSANLDCFALIKVSDQ